jgi:hypothetical protein
MGKPNAAVLPVPVCALPMRSRPSSARGMAFACTGVGTRYPSKVRLFLMAGESPKFSKDMEVAPYRLERFPVNRATGH